MLQSTTKNSSYMNRKSWFSVVPCSVVLQPWQWRQHGPPPPMLHGTTAQKAMTSTSLPWKTQILHIVNSFAAIILCMEPNRMGCWYSFVFVSVGEITELQYGSKIIVATW